MLGTFAQSGTRSPSTQMADLPTARNDQALLASRHPRPALPGADCLCPALPIAAHARPARIRGVSLVELMVGLVIGLLLILAATATYLTTGQTGRTALNTARLNTELGLTMGIMVDDIRRAGFSGSLANNRRTADQGFVNAFTAAGTDIAVSNDGTCLEYTYDANGDGVVDDNNERFGFRVVNGAILMRVGGAGAISAPPDCTTGNWLPLTDPQVITIVPHRNGDPFFAIDYQCLDTLNGVSAEEPCRAGQPVFNAATAEVAANDDVGIDLVETRLVSINLGGRLPMFGGPELLIEQSQQVQVRNHRVLSLLP